MLIKFKNDYEKIAMGLLSYVPDLKDVNHLKTEMRLYTQDDSHALFLYKEGRDFLGVVGVETGRDFVLVRHLSFSPGYRDAKTLMAALDELVLQYPDRQLMGTLETAPVIAAFKQERKEDSHGADASH